MSSPSFRSLYCLQSLCLVLIITNQDHRCLCVGTSSERNKHFTGRSESNRCSRQHFRQSESPICKPPYMFHSHGSEKKQKQNRNIFLILNEILIFNKLYPDASICIKNMSVPVSHPITLALPPSFLATVTSFFPTTSITTNYHFQPNFGLSSLYSTFISSF